MRFGPLPPPLGFGRGAAEVAPETRLTSHAAVVRWKARRQRGRNRERSQYAGRRSSFTLAAPATKILLKPEMAIELVYLLRFMYGRDESYSELKVWLPDLPRVRYYAVISAGLATFGYNN